MKRVLFISTTFNSYYKEIIKEFVNNDYEVDWYSDRPSNSIFTRAMIRLNPSILKRKIRRYSNKIIEETKKNNYDLVFVILGQAFSCEFWEKLRFNNSNSKFIYYLWDSVENFQCIEKNYKYFDEVYSFDKNDCDRLGFRFHPLFYINQFNVEQVNNNCKYDYSYIGTVKPGRYEIINEITKQLDKNNYSGFNYFYLHSKNVLRYYKFKYKKEFENVKNKDLNYKLLSKKECFDAEFESRIIVDVPQPGQFGLTIRVFEAIGMNKKLITTNCDIKNYDFYNPKNVYVIENDKIDFNNIFFNSEFSRLDDSIKNKYSIGNWLKHILEEC